MATNSPSTRRAWIACALLTVVAATSCSRSPTTPLPHQQPRPTPTSVTTPQPQPGVDENQQRPDRDATAPVPTNDTTLDIASINDVVVEFLANWWFHGSATKTHQDLGRELDGLATAEFAQRWLDEPDQRLPDRTSELSVVEIDQAVMVDRDVAVVRVLYQRNADGADLELFIELQLKETWRIGALR